MGAHSHNESIQRKPKIKKEGGAKVHLIAFVVSLVLTALSFIAVGYEIIPVGFAVPFIIVLALIQAAFQLFIWMHLDQKGHEFARIGMATGALIIAFVVIVFVYWVW